jgi:hypothetical protein
MTLLQIVYVGTDITGLLLIIYCAFIKHLRKNENGVSKKKSMIQYNGDLV